MAKKEVPKTHVLMSDCIITELGRCNAGMMLAEADVLAGTWTWLQGQGYLKSVEEIKSEADGEDSKKAE